ncbi:MAG: rhodanese-like domain-containing protein [Chitinophagaceae bacterium]|nr:rhodanese-like domain-containing protein [Chitinophagaceae bacterium]
MNNISRADLEQWRAEGRPFVLIDVREPFEHEAFNIGGTNIPLAALVNSMGDIPADRVIVLYCAKGIRSVIGMQKLAARGYTQLYHLSGGIYPLSRS